MVNTKKRLVFLKEFFKDFKVASLIPTSNTAVKNALDKLNLETKKTVVEYGPGEGVFTYAILERLPADSKLIVIETNLEFINILNKIDDERLIVLHDSAENIEALMEKEDCASVDVIISGIPLSLLPKAVVTKIIQNSCKSLSENGILFIYQHSFFAMKFLKKEFTTVEKYFEPMNLPPLFFMKALKNKV
ncbi:MAG: methyltransferase [Chitinophagaceae bacterium]|nr:MAG: methyltransferase [Chitinophagaceae bacterium]